MDGGEGFRSWVELTNVGGQGQFRVYKSWTSSLRLGPFRPLRFAYFSKIIRSHNSSTHNGRQQPEPGPEPGSEQRLLQPAGGLPRQGCVVPKKKKRKSILPLLSNSNTDSFISTPGLDALETKFGGGKLDPTKLRSTNEKITDSARGFFEKATG